MEDNQNKIGRRSLFAGLGLAAGAGLVAKLLPTSAPTPQVSASQESQTSQDGRYRLSEHIKKYYRTTAI